MRDTSPGFLMNWNEATFSLYNSLKEKYHLQHELKGGKKKKMLYKWIHAYVLKGCKHQTMREFDRDRSTSKPKGSNYVAAPKITSSFWCGLQPLHAEFLLKERFWINEPQKWHSLTAEQAENSDKREN